MKIHKIYIKSFGGLKDHTLDLSDGLNVIHGSNEFGKSTLMAFIKMTFYGTEGKSASLSKNLRKLYSPWDGETPSGYIEFDDNDRRYRLSRIFIGTNTSDKIELWDLTTNERVNFAGTPGEYFFGVTAAAFEKTAFIGQLGAFTTPDRNEEINTKLANFMTSSDDPATFGEANTILEKRLFELKSKSGKIGVIDKLNQKQSDLKDDIVKATEIEEQKLQLELEGKRLREQLSDISQECNVISAQVSKLENVRKYDEYNQILMTHKNLDKLKEEIKFRKSRFEVDGVLVDNNFIEKAENLFSSVVAVEDQLLHQNRALKSLPSAEEEAKESGDDNQDELDKETVDKIKAAENNLVKIKKDVAAIESKMQADEFSDIGAMEDRVRYADDNVQRIRRLLEIDKKRLENQSKYTQSNRLNIPLIVIGVLIAGIAIYLGATIDSYLYYVGALGLVLVLVAFFLGLFGKKSKDLRHQNNKLESDVRSFQEEFNLAKNELAVSKKELERAREEQSVHIKKYTEQKKKLVAQYKKEKASYLESLSKYGVKTFDELLDTYMKAQQKVSEKTGRRTAVTEQISELETKLKAIKFEINVLLQPLSKLDDFDGNKQYFKRLKYNMHELMQAEFDYSSKLKLYQQSLDGRNIADIEEVVKELSALIGERYEKYDENVIESLKAKLNSKVAEMAQLKDSLATLHAKLDFQFKDKLEISACQAELQSNEQKLNYLNDEYEALKLAATVLNEAHSELRNNFMPLLDKRASEIFSQLTKGKYDNIKVSRDFNLSVEEDGFLREWQYLSSGTIDQAYFSLQLALSEMLWKGSEALPQLLDDVFVRYDDVRVEKAMHFLKAYAKDRQVILFTCHNRILNLQ